jgi:hypothetical protein
LLVTDILYSSGFVNLSFSWFFMDAALGANVLTLSHISTCFFSSCGYAMSYLACTY